MNPFLFPSTILQNFRHINTFNPYFISNILQTTKLQKDNFIQFFKVQLTYPLAENTLRCPHCELTFNLSRTLFLKVQTTEQPYTQRDLGNTSKTLKKLMCSLFLWPPLCVFFRDPPPPALKGDPYRNRLRNFLPLTDMIMKISQIPSACLIKVLNILMLKVAFVTRFENV